MWTLLKSFIKERPAVYCVHPICTMANREGAVFRDYFIHTFTSLIRGYREYSQLFPLFHYQALRLSPSGINGILSN